MGVTCPRPHLKIIAPEQTRGLMHILSLINPMYRPIYTLRPPTPPFEAILHDRNQLKRHVILCFRPP